MTWWMWMIMGLVLLVGEIMTPGSFFLLFFGLGAIVVGALAALDLGEPSWMRWLMFSVLSIGMLLMLRKHFTCMHGAKGTSAADTDQLVGESVLILNEIGPHGTGRVELRGTTWNAKNVTAQGLHVEQQCLVDSVDGLTLNIKPQL